jgi:hypothetical protein
MVLRQMALTRLIVLFSGILLVTGALLTTGCGYDENKGLFMAPGAYTDLAVVLSSEGLNPLASRFLTGFNTTKTFVIKEEPPLPGGHLPG